ncbi:MAG: MarR family winged helix-turn-helix transcriptional regulator, partial [Verrucomicrobiota bacterium]
KATSATSTGSTQRALTDLMASDPNTITSTLSRMETAGLISRKPHELDRRAHRVRIQPDGLSAFEKAKAIAIDLQETVTAPLPAGRREKFFEELEAIADACAAVAEKPSRKRV